MTPKIPEIPYIHPPYKVEGPPKQARESFYEFAKKRVKYLTNEEIRKWDLDRWGDPESKRPMPTLYVISTGGGYHTGENLEKWVDNLEIVINKDAFRIQGKDYSDLIPFALEHEIYEAWLSAKKGTASTLDEEKQHILAQRKAFLLAEQQGLGNRFLEWFKLIDPENIKHIKQCEYALKAAKKQLGRLENKK